MENINDNTTDNNSTNNNSTIDSLYIIRNDIFVKTNNSKFISEKNNYPYNNLPTNDVEERQLDLMFSTIEDSESFWKNTEEFIQTLVDKTNKCKTTEFITIEKNSHVVGISYPLPSAPYSISSKPAPKEYFSLPYPPHICAALTLLYVPNIALSVEFYGLKINKVGYYLLSAHTILKESFF